MKDSDLDILVQKYLSNDLSSEEQEQVNSLIGSVEWESAVQQYSDLEKEYERTMYLNEQEKIIRGLSASSKRNRTIIYSAIALAAVVVIGFLVSSPSEKDESLAQRSADNEKYYTEEEGEAADEEEATDMAEENDSFLKFNESDQGIVSNGSIYSFEDGNGAFTRLKAKTTSGSNGILTAISTLGSTDSVYVFIKTIDGDDYEKHLRFVGKTQKYIVFNLISTNLNSGDSQKSILITDYSLDYYGRYLVSTSDDLPDQTLPVGLLYEIEKPDGTWTHAIVEFNEDECLDLPSGETSCISRY